MIEAEKMKKLEENWKVQHYVGHQGYIPDTTNASYLNILRNFRNKVKIQLNFEKEEMVLINNKIIEKFKDLKVKLIETWKIIDYFDQPKAQPANDNTVETKNAEKCTNLEREYMNQEKIVDGFSFNQLN